MSCLHYKFTLWGVVRARVVRWMSAAAMLMLAVGAVARSEMIQPRRLIDAHTAGILPRAHFDMECRIYPSGADSTPGAGVTLGIAVGITDRLNIGVSYGGDGFIGRNAMQLNPHLGGLIKYRIIEENYFLPALALGYDHQGFGGIDGRNSRYIYPSQGLFIALSKNYLLLSKVQMGIHGACSYSLELTDIRWPNGYAGIDIGFNEELAVAVEYDLALTSNDDLNPLHGYLNLGLRWAFSQAFYIEFAAKDVLESKIIDPAVDRPLGWSRELKLVYIEQF